MIVIDGKLQQRIDAGSLSPADCCKLALVNAADRPGLTVYSSAQEQAESPAVVVRLEQAICRTLLGTAERWEFFAVLEFLAQNPVDADQSEQEMLRLVEVIRLLQYDKDGFVVKGRRGERTDTGARVFCRLVLELEPDGGNGEGGVMRMLEETVGI